MKKSLFFLLGLFLSLQNYSFAQEQKDLRMSIPLSDWSFSKGDFPTATESNFDDSAWEKLRIPHDWAIYGPFDKNVDIQVLAIEQNQEKVASEKTGRTGALPYIGTAWYRCRLDASAYRGKRLVLVFDGAMSNARVYLNGQEILYWPYGYNSFYADISDELKPDASNILAVRLQNVGQSSRWYPGAGLYRHVNLLVSNPVSVDVWGTFITTPLVTEQVAKIQLKTRIHKPEAAKELSLSTEIFDPRGRSLFVQKETLLIAGEFDQIMAVEHPQLWSPESPALYKAVSTLYDGNEAIDKYTTRFGIRSISVDAQGGFQLNGKSRKFKGVCLHHDLGPLGAAINRSALKRQLLILKEMGCDAIRSSHNMPSPEQVELCDELGIMLMAESFDEWARPKVRNGYNLYYKDWVEKDIINLVRRYRNHPSVVMWSAGNEVPDQWTELGIKEGKRLQDIFHREDPTRPVTMGMDQVARTIQNGFAAYWDVPGLNYRLPLYAEAQQRLPQGFLLGSETASTVSSRGVYKFPVQEYKNKKYEDGQCSSYDLEACSWSNIPDDDWLWQDDHDWVIGEFVWTGFDYLGEPTPYDDFWPSRSSYFGICDLAGLAKDRYYLYRSRWRTDDNTLHILPHWNWKGKEGDTIPVFVYTNHPSAELFVNGKSQGLRKKHNEGNRLERYRLMWNDCVYEAGTLRVVAFNDQGEPVDTSEIKTAGKPSQMELIPEQKSIKAGEDELCFVQVRIVDAQGNFCPTASNSLQFKVKGQGRFRAACNGDATSTELFHLPQMKVFNGMLVVLLQSNGQAGHIELTVSGEGLKRARMEIPVY